MRPHPTPRRMGPYQTGTYQMRDTAASLCQRDNLGMLGISLTNPITIHFYQPHKGLPLEVALWSRLKRPRFIHCTVEINGVLWNQPLRERGGWWLAEPSLKARPSQYQMKIPVNARLLDVAWASLFISGYRTQRLASALNVLTGFPQRPFNCATTASYLLQELGVDVFAATPDQLWSELNALELERQAKDVQRERSA